MPKLSPKSIAILLGIVFFLGGVTMVSAQPAPLPLSASAIATATGNTTIGFLLDSWVSCSGFGSCLLSFVAAGPSIIFYFIYKIASVLFLLAGMLFDYVLFLSINSKFVDQPFITSLWTTMRDFSNMAFIFVLLYTGAQTILGMGNWRKTVLNVIIVALLINFSLFFTKVVIDAGNVLALGVYNMLGTPASPGGAISLSSSLVEAIQPQRFTAMAAAEGAQGAILVFSIAILINGIMAWVFFTTALVFVGRLMAFWFLMIISPFAFISITFPKGNIFGWWTSTLLNQSFLAPVFLFAMLIILNVVNDGNGILMTITSSSGITSSGMISDMLVAPILMATLLVVAMTRVKDLAKKMAGEFGEAGSKLLSGALTAVSVGARIGTAVATGGASMMVGGLNVGGRQLIKARGEGSMWNKFSKESTVGKFAQNLSFDPRTIGGDDSIFGHVAGGVIRQGVGQLGIGKGVGEGGVAATSAKQDKINESKALKGAEGAKMSRDEENRMRAREKKIQDEKLAKAELAKKKAEEAKEVARKAHDESETAKIVKAIQVSYQEAVKKGSASEIKSTADLLKLAKEAHETSDTGKTLKEATGNLETATAQLEKAGKHTEDAVKEANSARTDVHAEKAEAKGDYITAAKIRKGEKGGKKSVKELLDEALKESGEKKETPEGGVKH